MVLKMGFLLDLVWDHLLLNQIVLAAFTFSNSINGSQTCSVHNCSNDLVAKYKRQFNIYLI